MLDKAFKLTAITIADGGNGIATWAPLVEGLLDSFGQKAEPKKEETSDIANTYQVLVATPCPSAASLTFEDIADGWQFERALGRTLLFQQNGHYRAVKLQRSNESVDTLWREYRTVQLFDSEEAQPLNLLSKWPTPITVANVIGIPTELLSTVTGDLDLTNGSVNVYVYEFTDDSYFRYLHDPALSTLDFNLARQAMLHDLFVLARHGVVWTALADLFHNLEDTEDRPDRGSYLPLADIFRIQGGRSGTGRLTGWLKGVEYPNARASGLADTADTDLIHHIIDNLDQTGLTEIGRKRLKGLDLFLLAHFASSYLLVDQLILGRRNLESMNWKDADVVNSLAEQLASGLTVALAAYTSVPLASVEAFVQKGGLDWVNMARQLCFWMRNDEMGYVPHVKAGHIPKEIFGDATCTVDKVENLRGWDANGGFMLNPPNPDSGPVNGQHMVKEGERCWHVTALFLAVMKGTPQKVEKWMARANVYHHWQFEDSQEQGYRQRKNARGLF